MDKLNCLIVEDEPIAAEVIADYVGQVPFLRLRGICSDAIYAMEVLQSERIDLLFLDIHLPRIKGLDFLKSLASPPNTILTTAYDQYALDAFEEGVIDYLMKPIDFPRFLKAVNKLNPSRPTVDRPFSFFVVNKRRIKLYFEDVTHVESLKDYCRIFTEETSLVVRGNIGEFEAQFVPHGFIRIHRSFLVATKRINSFTAADVEVNGKHFPIGRSYKDTVLRLLES